MIEKSFAAVKFAGIAAKQRKGYSLLNITMKVTLLYATHISPVSLLIDFEID